MKTVFDDLGRDPTPVEIIDYVEKHLIAQGQQSIEDRTCKYRQGNLSCAVGCLVDDETAKKWDDITPSGVNTVIDRFTSEIPPWFKQHAKVLRYLQNIHDNGSNWDERGFVGQNDIKHLTLCVLEGGFTNET